MKTPKKRINIYLDPATEEAVKSEAKRQNRSFANMVETLLKIALEKK